MDTLELTQVIAYRIYELRGRGDGHELSDWVAAERLVQDVARLWTPAPALTAPVETPPVVTTPPPAATDPAIAASVRLSRLEMEGGAGKGLPGRPEAVDARGSPMTGAAEGRPRSPDGASGTLAVVVSTPRRKTTALARELCAPGLEREALAALEQAVARQGRAAVAACLGWSSTGPVAALLRGDRAVDRALAARILAAFAPPARAAS